MVQVLEEGALQPVVGLLASSCPESQREAALLLGQFATTDADTKVRGSANSCSRLPHGKKEGGGCAVGGHALMMLFLCCCNCRQR
jgi:hypothetical protein